MKVAYLTEQHWRQKDIQGALDIKSQAEVSRLLSEARKERWFVERFEPPEDVDRKEIERSGYLKRDELLQRLKRTADDNQGVPPTEVHVLYSGPEEIDEKRLQSFGKLSAERIVQLLSGATICAVAWGRTIKNTVESLPSSISPRPKMMFLPVSGEPFNHTEIGVSPSTAAEKLAKAFHCEVKNLRGVGVRIPKGMAEQAKTIRKFLMTCDHYDQIFGESEPFIERVDAIISGIGDAESSENDPWFRETEQAEGMQKADLNRISVGNLGGVWFPKDRDNPEHVNTVKEINERWLGIQQVHFEKCAKRAASSPSQGPGVILLAIGSRKCSVVRRAIGIVNHLIVDHSLADALLSDCRPEQGEFAGSANGGEAL